jgi:uracil-DNA glycosylase family 4
MDLLDKLEAQIKICPLCRLSKSRVNAVPGEGNKRAEIMLVGEAPGGTEDRQGRPFVGRAGKLLDKLLEKNGIKRDSTYITNIVKCRPPDNRKPRSDEIEACSGYLKSEINFIKPNLIVTLGVTPLYCLTDRKKTIGSVHGSLIKQADENSYYYIFPTYHPAAALRARPVRKLLEKDFEKLPRALSAAKEKDGRRKILEPM